MLTRSEIYHHYQKMDRVLRPFGRQLSYAECPSHLDIGSMDSIHENIKSNNHADSIGSSRQLASSMTRILY